MRAGTSYFGCRHLAHVTRDMRRLAKDRLDVVVHTCSEHDARFGAKTMHEVVAATRALGLEVWLDPWGVGGVFGGEAFSRAASHEPEWAQRQPDGTRLPACCPSHPGFRAFFAEWIAAATATGAEAVFLDEPHFHGEARGCACAHCRALGAEPAAALLDFLAWCCREVRAHGARPIVCLLPPGHGGTALRWNEVAALDGLHGIGTTAYWAAADSSPEPTVEAAVRDVLRAAAERELRTHVWVQGFGIAAGHEAEIRRAVRTAVSAGVDDVLLWGFDGCASMSALACARPKVAWREFLAGVRSGDR